jgi:DNA-directed RNA polymerase subunit RPC12/RpoP
MTPRCWACGRFSSDPAAKLGLSCSRCYSAMLVRMAAAWASLV